MPLPGDDVFAEVQRLVRNLIAMNEILRDRSRASIRLVMNPDRMVIREAQRTFTYLNLYGFLTDAVVVNRVFPEDVEGSYFGLWRERQREHLGSVREGFAPVPVLTARYFEEEVVGPRMLDRLAGELFAEHVAHDLLHTELAHELTSVDGRAELRLAIPFAEKGEIDLKKVGPELVVSVGREKRTIILPSALARQRPAGAAFERGTLTVSFTDERDPAPRGPDLEPLASAPRAGVGADAPGG
jgi:arsenite-transporting ATPase